MLLTVNRSSLTVETFGLVGPEWWLTERDYESLKWINYEVRELGETMLRTETAAIVGGWLIRNSKF
jgi:16S rRNA U1498 N3-methylase RsmE